jgi:hypothetical protein
MLGDLDRSASQDVLLIFMCGNDPGMCSEWEAAAGGNQALLVAAGGRLTPAAVPAGPATVLGEVSAVRYVTVSADYGNARYAWAEREGRPAGDVLGQLGGRPEWIQADETPACPRCGKPMAFVVQLEEGHDYRTAANFGGAGCGYGFTCQPCGTAAFLWQCLRSRCLWRGRQCGAADRPAGDIRGQVARADGGTTVVIAGKTPWLQMVGDGTHNLPVAKPLLSRTVMDDLGRSQIPCRPA